MLTLDDKRVREALIHTHDQFAADPKSWGKRYWEQKSGSFLHRNVSRCMMGEVGHQLLLKADHAGLFADGVWVSVLNWFGKKAVGRDAMVFNDTTTYDTMMKFLEARIADLDAELIKDAPRSSSLLTTALGLFA